MHSSIAFLALNLALAASQNHSAGWSAANFKNLVTFGDSYTDESRLSYFINNNGSAPPVGWAAPTGYNTASGGRTWPRYAAIYNDATLYNYAVSGAVCSNSITPRYFSAINAPFPDIAGYELPAFIADSHYVSPNGTKFFAGTSQDTAYAIWIGTNDLGNDAFLTDSQVPGKTLVDCLDCVYDTIDGLYKNGGRNFVLMNLAPLQLLPQYSTPENGGQNATRYFPNKTSIAGGNITEISWRMYESVATVNAVYKYRTPFEILVNPNRTWPHAKIANFNVNGLLTDIRENPASYLNGTVPLDVEGWINHCDLSGTVCVPIANGTARDSFEWFDELHPSEQTDRVVAREFVGVLDGGSRWAEYWG